MPEIKTFKLKEAILFSVKETIQNYPALLVAVIKSMLALFAALIALSFILPLFGGAISPIFFQTANILFFVLIIAICGSFSRYALSIHDGESIKSFKVVDLKGSLRLLITNLTVLLPFLLAFSLLVYLPDSLSDIILISILGLITVLLLYTISRSLYSNYFIVDYDLGSLDALKNSFLISSKSKIKSVLWYGFYALTADIILGISILPFSNAITLLPLNTISLDTIEANLPLITNTVMPNFLLSLALLIFTIPFVTGLYFFGSAKIFRDLSDEEVPEYEIIIDSNTAEEAFSHQERTES